MKSFTYSFVMAYIWTLLSSFFTRFISCFYVCKYFAFICSCAPCVSLVPTKTKRGLWIPRTGVKDTLYASMWVLGTESWSSATSASVFNSLQALFFRGTVSCSPGWLQTFCVVEADLELEVLPLPPKCWDHSMWRHAWSPC